MRRVFAHLYAMRMWIFLTLASVMGPGVVAAPYAAMVMDARTGEVLHSRNADTRLHPASLTKMMTLYVVFEALQHGEITLDTRITIPAQAAAEPPSKLGLRAGQKIRLRYLIRAAAIKSANDAATALAFAIEGSEAGFARRMNATAKAMGMSRTTFRNAHGLTQNGHMSTARDMTILGRHLIYDYPQYYNLFSRLTEDAGIGKVRNTNRRLLSSYRGADGIKTGYTRAAGSNLVASAERGSERIIATMFGGTSSAQRNARVAQLLDMGFSRAPTTARLRAPARPRYQGSGSRAPALASTAAPSAAGPAAKTIRVTGAVTRSLRPRARPITTAPAPATLASTAAIQGALTQAMQVQTSAPLVDGITSTITPRARPPVLASAAPRTQPTPDAAEPQVVTRVAATGGRNWGINVGRYTTKYQAERVLLKVALNEMESLDGGLRKVMSSQRGHDATFTGLSRDQADRACRRLQSKGTSCFMIGP